MNAKSFSHEQYRFIFSVKYFIYLFFKSNVLSMNYSYSNWGRKAFTEIQNLLNLVQLFCQIDFLLRLYKAVTKFSTATYTPHGVINSSTIIPYPHVCTKDTSADKFAFCYPHKDNSFGIEEVLLTYQKNWMVQQEVAQKELPCGASFIVPSIVFFNFK